MKKERSKRGRKRQTEKGILEGEQLIKKFLVKQKETETQKTPKRKRMESSDKEEIMVFGQEDTPGKTIKTMLDNNQQRRKLMDKGGKIKRMIANFEMGMEGKDPRKEEIYFLGKDKENSSRKQEETVRKEIERINATYKCCFKLKINSKFNSYEAENGDLRNSKLGPKIGCFNGVGNNLVRGFDSRGGESLQHDECLQQKLLL